MTITANQIMTLDGQILPFARDLREAFAIYARRQWPLNTAMHAAKAWGISKTTATNLLKGHASDSTITAVLRAGGWSLALAVVGATIGESLDDFIERERERHERQVSRLRALGGDLRPLAGVRRDLSAEPASASDRRRSPVDRRVGQKHR